MYYANHGFNTQPPEGGWTNTDTNTPAAREFQHTATRRWLGLLGSYQGYSEQFQHTATRRWLDFVVSMVCIIHGLFQHTATRRWLAWARRLTTALQKFQHTATRRWLDDAAAAIGGLDVAVSTHSHPKVAGGNGSISANHAGVFQHTATRRWLAWARRLTTALQKFQHTATRRWLVK